MTPRHGHPRMGTEACPGTNPLLLLQQSCGKAQTEPEYPLGAQWERHPRPRAGRAGGCGGHKGLLQMPFTWTQLVLPSTPQPCIPCPCIPIPPSFIPHPSSLYPSAWHVPSLHHPPQQPPFLIPHPCLPTSLCELWPPKALRCSHAGGSQRGDQEQPEPRVCQDLHGRLLLRGGAEAAVRGVRQPWPGRRGHARR